MDIRLFAGRLGYLGILGGLLLASACSSGSKTQTAQQSGNGLTPGEGYCQATCAKDCVGDQDCDMSKGEMCCKMGDYGSLCRQASSCPVECVDESKCNTQSGQACERVTLATAQNYCAAPEPSPHIAAKIAPKYSC